MKIRDLTGLLLVVASFGALGVGSRQLLLHDYLASALLLTVGLSLLGAGVELLRATIGE